MDVGSVIGIDAGLILGVIALGIVHGVLPDHGWPIAATYALERRRQWLGGTVAALVLGIGHLISSVALVVAYFWFSTFAAFAESPWMKPIAGGLLILLGVYTYVGRGGGHGHGHDHGGGVDDHDHADHHAHGVDGDHHHAHGADDHHKTDDHPPVHGTGDHQQAHDGETAKDDGLIDSIRERLPDGGHAHLDEEHARQGLWTLGATALVLGFAHEEPIQILAICAGTAFCLELMLVYSLAVILAILAPTLLLIAGYRTHRERIETYTPYLPAVTAAVLVGVGLGFVVGVF